MKIGVAIPCFIKHIDRCLELLDSINTQTVVPDEVVVSCSSSKPTDFPIKDYKFALKVVTTEERRNAAQNRNIAAANLDTDIVCFFDADDIMHPQRLECISAAFQEGADIVLHSFFEGKECLQEFPKIDTIKTNHGVLSKCGSGCIKYDYIQRITHGHVSVTRAVFQTIQFPEETMFETKEDCVFCFNVFSLPNIRSCYLQYPLSKYIPSGTCISEHA